MGHTAPLLQMAGICKSFGSAQVLREVDLRSDAGEVLALCTLKIAFTVEIG